MKNWTKTSFRILSLYRSSVSPETYARAERTLRALLDKETVPSAVAEHAFVRIFPLLSLYTSCVGEDAYARVSRLFWDKQVRPKLPWIRRMMKIPGSSRVFTRLVARAIRTTYKPTPDGFQYTILESSRDCIRFDFHQCPYQMLCQKHGVPELCDVFCTSDDLVAEAFAPNIVFERSQTLARGGSCCDFCYRVRRRAQT